MIKRLSRKFSKRKLLKNKIQLYISYKNKCEVCGNRIFIDWRRDPQTRNTPLRFCSPHCARSFSSNCGKKDPKILFCNDCGASVVAGYRASAKKILCPDCRKKHIKDWNIQHRGTMEDRYPNREIIYDINAPIRSKVSCLYCKKFIPVCDIAEHEAACSLNPNKIIKTYKKRPEHLEGYIYLIENKLNGKKYIGKRIGKPEESKSYFGSGKAIKAAIKKYGKENFTKTILEYTPNGDLNELEKYYISLYNTYKKGYNLTQGGDGGNTKEYKKQTK